MPASSVTEPATEKVSQQPSATPGAGPAQGIPVTKHDINNQNIRLEVELDRDAYDLQSFIHTKVVITNIGQQKIAYLLGSGSNIAPQALEYTLGELAALFHPDRATRDYRVEILEPGNSLELDLPFAPYIAGDKDMRIGTQRELDFFQSDDFTPAEAGTVHGRAVFSYKIVPEDAGPDALTADFEQLPSESISLEFETTIEA